MRTRSIALLAAVLVVIGASAALAAVPSGGYGGTTSQKGRFSLVISANAITQLQYSADYSGPAFCARYNNYPNTDAPIDIKIKKGRVDATLEVEKSTDDVITITGKFSPPAPKGATGPTAYPNETILGRLKEHFQPLRGGAECKANVRFIAELGAS